MAFIRSVRYAALPITRVSAIVSRSKRLPITGEVGALGEDRAGRDIGEVAAGYEKWLAKQPLSGNTKRAYRTRAGQFLAWLAATPCLRSTPATTPLGTSRLTSRR